MKSLLVLLTALSLVIMPMPFNNTYAMGLVKYGGDLEELDYLRTGRLKRDIIRQAAVKVVTGMGHGSGTYMKMGNARIVLTAYHVVDETAGRLSVVAHTGEMVPARILYTPELFAEDIAVLVVDQKLKTITPMVFQTRKEIVRVNKKLFYTGFPATHFLLSFEGKTAGYINREGDFNILVNTYVWFGSSGSCLFDEAGNIVAIVSAIEVRRFDDYEPHTNLMWAKPVTSSVKRTIRKAITKDKRARIIS